MNVAFIGLGNMGLPMAHNIRKAGFQLIVYNRTRKKAESLQAEGASIAASPSDAVKEADVVITMLSDDKALEEVIFEPGGAMVSMRKGAIHVSMSTISVILSQFLTESHRQNGQHFISATVFGRPEAAAEAKLFVVAAGKKELIPICQPIFDSIGQRTFIAGEKPEAANVMKLAGNFLITTVIESLAESIALVRKFGLDQHVFLDILTNTLFPAPVYRTYGGMIADNKYEPVGFKMPLGMKDNHLLLKAASQVKVPMSIASLIRDRFITAMAQGLDEADWAAIAKITFGEAGI